MPGENTSQVEISGISRHGFWIFLDEEELFVPFSEFPWFHAAPVWQVFHVERPQSHHLHWPGLDVDLHVDSIRHPERFPLVSRNS